MKFNSLKSLLTSIFITIFFTGCGIGANEIFFTQDEIRISGLYGEKINIRDVSEIELLDRIPKILLRTGGTNFGEARKGYFRLEDRGRAKLLLQSSRSAPFILIEKNNGERIYINYIDRNKTRNYYQKLSDWINEN